MAVGVEFNTNTNKIEVVKILISLFYIFAYYSKDTWFDLLLALFCIKWDGFRDLLKRFKLLFVYSFIHSFIHPFVHQSSLSHMLC